MVLLGYKLEGGVQERAFTGLEAERHVVEGFFIYFC